jgi:MFS family permease
MIHPMKLFHARVQFDHSIKPLPADSILSALGERTMDNRKVVAPSNALTLEDAPIPETWSALLVPRLILPLSVLLGGNLLHSMNVLITATLLPSIVADIGGSNLMSWPTTAFVAASIIAATGSGFVSKGVGTRGAFCGGAIIYATGSVLCALAPSIVMIIGGRFVQGLGGGLLSAVAYVLVRSVFSEPLWPRALGLLASVWSVTVLVGPLIGGVFAGYRHWRGAFFAVAGLGGLLAIGAFIIFPAGAVNDDPNERRFPFFRVVLICAYIAFLSLASVLVDPAVKGTFIMAAIGAFVLMLRIDRDAVAPLLPSDAFSLRSATGTALWMVLLLSVAYSPLAIYVPLFLQRLHGVNPLVAGYIVAGASLAWTCAALTVASLSEEWPRRLIVAGPIVMSLGLFGVTALMAPGPVVGLIPAIGLIGIGIGASWAFIAQSVMRGAKSGEETVAAACVATVQQVGIALGAAIAGLIANASGLVDGLQTDSLRRAAFWMPMLFVAAPLAAGTVGTRLNRITGRSGQVPSLGAEKG